MSSHNAFEQQQSTATTAPLTVDGGNNNSNNTNNSSNTPFTHNTAFGSSFAGRGRKTRFSKQELLDKFEAWQSSNASKVLPEGFTVWSTVTSQNILAPVNTTDLFQWDANTRICPDSTKPKLLPSSSSTLLASSSSSGGGGGGAMMSGGRGRGRGRGGSSHHMGVSRLNTHHNARPDSLVSPSTPPMQPLWATDMSDDDILLGGGEHASHMHINNNNNNRSVDSNLVDNSTFGSDANEGFSLESLSANTQRMTDSWRSAFKQPSGVAPAHGSHHHQQQQFDATSSPPHSSPALEDHSWRRRAAPAVNQTGEENEQQQVESPLKLPDDIDYESHWLYTNDNKTYQGPFTLEKLKEWVNSGYFSAETVFVKPFDVNDQSQSRKYSPLILKQVLDMADECEKKRAIENVLMDDDDHHHHSQTSAATAGAQQPSSQQAQQANFPPARKLQHQPMSSQHQQPQQPMPNHQIPPQHVGGGLPPPRHMFPHPGPHQQLPRGVMPQHPQQYPPVGPHHWNPHMMPPRQQYEMMMRMQQQGMPIPPQFMSPTMMHPQPWVGFGGPAPISDELMTAEQIEQDLKMKFAQQRQEVMMHQMGMHPQHFMHMPHPQQHTHIAPQNVETPVAENLQNENVETEQKVTEISSSEKQSKTESPKDGYVLDDDTFIPSSSASLVIEPSSFTSTTEEKEDKASKKKKKKSKKSKAKSQEVSKLVNPLPHQPTHQEPEPEQTEEQEEEEPEVFPQEEEEEVETEQTELETEDNQHVEEEKPEPSAVKTKPPKPQTEILIVSTPATWSNVSEQAVITSTADVMKQESKLKKKVNKEKKKMGISATSADSQEPAWGLASSAPSSSILDIQSEQVHRKEQEKNETQRSKATSKQNVSSGIWGANALTPAVEETKKNISKKDKKPKKKQEDEEEDDLFWNYDEGKETKTSNVPSSKDFPAPTKKATTTTSVPTVSKKAAKSQKTKSDFSYASILSSPSSRQQASVIPVNSPSVSTKLMDNSQFPSLASKKAPSGPVASAPVAQTSTTGSSSFIADFPLPVKKSQSKNASKKTTKKK